jgi:hypothetical protein
MSPKSIILQKCENKLKDRNYVYFRWMDGPRLFNGPHQVRRFLLSNCLRKESRSECLLSTSESAVPTFACIS